MDGHCKISVKIVWYLWKCTYSLNFTSGVIVIKSTISASVNTELLNYHWQHQYVWKIGGHVQYYNPNNGWGYICTATASGWTEGTAFTVCHQLNMKYFASINVFILISSFCVSFCTYLIFCVINTTLSCLTEASRPSLASNEGGIRVTVCALGLS